MLMIFWKRRTVTASAPVRRTCPAGIPCEASRLRIVGRSRIAFCPGIESCPKPTRAAVATNAGSPRTTLIWPRVSKLPSTVTSRGR